MSLHARYVLSPLLILLFIQAPTANEELNTNEIDAYIASAMRWPRIPGVAVAIVKGDRIVYLKGYGEADPNRRPVTPQTPFILGSITKAFTALAVMQLVEAGKVELDAPVQRYIPWFRVADPVASTQITVRQMLNQTNGLPMIREPQFVTDQDAGVLERTVRSFASARLDAPPGQGYTYSNANYDTLGLLVQIVSAKPYEEYVKEQIFAPLEMKNSFTSQEEAEAQGMATGHRWWFGFPRAFRAPYVRAELPAGYIISSAEDMAHFMIAELNGGRYGDSSGFGNPSGFGKSSVLSSDGIALTHTPPASRVYAMGWERLEVGGRHLVNHDGGTTNFQTSLFLDPDERVGVFVAANVMSALDAFSSPHGSTALDGATTRGIALSVLSLATDRPLPDQGRGKRRLYLILDLVILTLTVLLVISLVTMGRRYRRWRQRGIANWSTFAWRSVVKAVTHFTLPLLVIYAALKVLMWGVLLGFQPDLIYWLIAVATVLFVKGVVEIMLLGRVFRETHAR